LIINTDGAGEASAPTGRSPKHFEARWLKEETFNEIVQTAWARATQERVSALMTKVNRVHSELHDWDRDVLKKLVHRIKKLRRELEMLGRGEMTHQSIAAQKEVLLQLELLLEQEEVYWVQRARANWLKHGDRNTSFFHHQASNRRRKNLIKCLVDDGVRYEDNGAMGALIKDYFSNLDPVRLAYQPPASSTFLSQQTSHQQSASSTLLSEQTSTNHQPPANRTGSYIQVKSKGSMMQF
jgi:hypothetical protein